MPFSEDNTLIRENQMLKVSNKESMLYFGKFDSIQGQYILTGGANPNEVYLMDIANRHYATWYGMKGEIFSGEFSPDNKLVAFGGAEGIVRIYSLELK